MKPEGVTLPLRTDLTLVSIEAPDLFDRIEFRNTPSAGFDFSSTWALAVNAGFKVNLTPESACAAAVAISRRQSEPRRKGACPWRGHSDDSPGPQDAWAGRFFVAQSAAGISMTNWSFCTERIHRRQLDYPVDRAVHGGFGVKEDSSRNSAWRGIRRTSDDLTRTQKGFKSKPIPRGEAPPTLMDLCHGLLTITQIEDEVPRLYPDLFRNREEAAAWVAEVVTRYAE